MAEAATQTVDYSGILDELPKLSDVQRLGKVMGVVGLVVEACMPDMPIGGMCSIRLSNGKSVDAEVVGLKGQHALMMPIGETEGIKLGCLVEPKRSDAAIFASEEMLGRVIDARGDPMDGGKPIIGGIPYKLYNVGANPVTRKLVKDPLQLGVRAIDGLITCGIGQRMTIMAGSGVGKSVLLGMVARHTKADVNVIGLIGERGREVREFIEKDLGKEGLARSVVVVATSDSPPLLRMRGAYVATAIAEYFRDQGKKVLLLMDSLTRFAMAGREVGLAVGEPPTVKGYTPSVFATLPKLLERAGTTDGNGSITGLYSILIEADDINDPIADAVRAIVDGHIVLSRKLASLNHYPAIDILNSLSRVHRAVANERHLKVADRFRTLWSSYIDMEDYINMGVYAAGKNKTVDEAIARVDTMKSFLKQRVEDVSTLQNTIDFMAQTVGV